MPQTTFDDPDRCPNSPVGCHPADPCPVCETQEVFWDDLNEWETEQVYRDGWYDIVADELEIESTLDLYDQYEYQAEHQEEE